jgi:hypothetical protein
MTARNLIEFLRTVAARADLLDCLKVRNKDEVVAAASDFGLAFTEAEFDRLIWDLEAHLACKRREPFGAHFPLWETMWGKYYLEFLVLDMMPSLSEADVEAVLTQSISGQGR